VIVAGGGSAGIAAALAAEGMGARTLLVERSDVLGGNATNALVHTICGLYLPAEGARAPVPANHGFPLRFAAGLRACGGAGEPERAGRVWVLPTEPARIARHAAGLCEKAPGLHLRLRSRVVAAELAREAPGTSSVELRDAEGRGLVATARVAIDASGDAALAALGGAAVEQALPQALQSPSLIFRMQGVDTAAIEGFGRLRLTHAIAGAARERELPQGCESVLVRRAREPGQVYVTLNVPKLDDRAYEPLDPVYLDAIQERAVLHARELERFLRRSRPAFREARIAELPRRIGIRETRRVRGEVVMDEDDILQGRRRTDEVAVSSWPIELWHDHRRAEFRHPEGPASVPLGALVSRSHPCLGAAGRCLSATHAALGALRVIGAALATGEAIGVAAGLAADEGVALRDVDPERVREAIVERAEAGA
jgi:hypothetical protein